MSIAANKVGGIRAALAHDPDTARLAREHNDANVLTLGARGASDATGLEIVRKFPRREIRGRPPPAAHRQNHGNRSGAKPQRHEHDQP